MNSNQHISTNRNQNDPKSSQDNDLNKNNLDDVEAKDSDNTNKREDSILKSNVNCQEAIEKVAKGLTNTITSQI